MVFHRRNYINTRNPVIRNIRNFKKEASDMTVVEEDIDRVVDEAHAQLDK